MDNSTSPHILLVLDQFPKALGGGERIALRLARLLPRYGYRVSILTFFVHSESVGLIEPPCAIFLLPITKTYDLNAVVGALALRQFLKEHKVDLVHTFFESSDIWAGLVTKAMSKSKLVWSRRDMGILRTRKHHIAYRLMASVPDAVFAVSEQVRKHCIEVDKIDPERVQTVYNGLDLYDWNIRAAAPLRKGSQVITSVGNIRRVKGHDILVRAAAIVVKRFPQALFTIGGDVLEPEYFAELQRLVAQFALSGCFHFVGPVTNLPKHLATADIFVLPSRSEGFSNAIVEAMAASIPVVATDVGGNAEAVESGVTGFVVPSQDVEAMANAIMKLLSDPRAAVVMGAAGRDLAGRKFTTEAMMQVVTRTFARLLSTDSCTKR